MLSVFSLRATTEQLGGLTSMSEALGYSPSATGLGKLHDDNESSMRGSIHAAAERSTGPQGPSDGRKVGGEHRQRTPDATPRRPAPVISRLAIDRNFLNYLGARVASVFGDQFYFVALSWSAVRTSGAGGVTLALVAATTPRALLMLLGGVSSDRFGPRQIILWSSVSRGGAVGCLAVILTVTRPTLFLLCAVAFVFGVVDGLYYPADGSIVPLLVPRALLTKANALRQVAQQVALVGAGPLGGIVLAAFGLSAALAVDTVSFTLAAVAILVTQTARLSAVDDAALAGSGHLDQPEQTGSRAHDLYEGLAYSWRTPFVRAIVPAVIFAGFAFAGPANVGLPVLANRQHWGSSGFGILLGGLGVGSVVGSVIIATVHRPRRPGITIMAMLLLQSAGIAGCTQVGSAIAGALVLSVAGVGLGIASTVAFASVQSVTDERYLGRVMSLMALAMVGLAPVAYVITGVLDQAVGVKPALLAMAAMEAVVGVIGLTSRTVRRQPMA